MTKPSFFIKYGIRRHRLSLVWVMSIFLGLAVVLGVLVEGSYLNTVAAVVVGIVLGGYLVTISLMYGINVKHASYTEDGLRFVVRDVLFPLAPKKNFRELYLPDYSTDLRSSFNSRMFLSDPLKSMFPFLNHLLDREYTRALLLGGGGGAIAASLLENNQKLKVDIVDTSEGSIKISKQFFLQEYQHQVTYHHQDAYDFFSQTNNKYDFILLDIFDYSDNCKVPELFTSKGFAELIQKKLKKNGVFAANFGGVSTERFDISNEAAQNLKQHLPLKITEDHSANILSGTMTRS